jgi:hypothetical protein
MDTKAKPIGISLLLGGCKIETNKESQKCNANAVKGMGMVLTERVGTRKLTKKKVTVCFNCEITN